MAAAHFLFALCLAPLLPGLIGLVEALVSGGKEGGPPSLFANYQGWRALARHATQYAPGTSSIVTAAPVLALSCLLTALAVLPIGGQHPPLAFAGDFLVAGFLLVLAQVLEYQAAAGGSPLYALSRERLWSLAAIPLTVVLLALTGSVRESYSVHGMTGMASALATRDWLHAWPYLLPLCLAFLFLGCLVRNSDAGNDVDGPAVTGGLDRVLRDAAEALKLWFFAALIGALFPPPLKDPSAAFGAGVGGVLMAVMAMGALNGLLRRFGWGGGRIAACAGILTLAGVLVAIVGLFL